MASKIGPTVALSLTVKDAASALNFCAASLNAVEVFRMPAPDGSIVHAEYMRNAKKSPGIFHVRAIGTAVWRVLNDVSRNVGIGTKGVRRVLGEFDPANK